MLNYLHLSASLEINFHAPAHIQQKYCKIKICIYVTDSLYVVGQLMLRNITNANQALEYCTMMLIEAPVSPACEYRNLAVGQFTRPFDLGVSSRLTCLGLFLQCRISRVSPCIRCTPPIHLPRALPHPPRE